VKRQLAKWQLASVERAIIKSVSVIEKYGIEKNWQLAKLQLAMCLMGNYKKRECYWKI